MAVGRRDASHALENPGVKRRKSNQKYKKAINWYVDLLKREKKEGLTKWVVFTKRKCEERIKKYGISKNQIERSLERKGLLSLKN